MHILLEEMCLGNAWSAGNIVTQAMCYYISCNLVWPNTRREMSQLLWRCNKIEWWGNWFNLCISLSVALLRKIKCFITAEVVGCIFCRACVLLCIPSKMTHENDWVSVKMVSFKEIVQLFWDIGLFAFLQSTMKRSGTVTSCSLVDTVRLLGQQKPLLPKQQSGKWPT